MDKKRAVGGIRQWVIIFLSVIIVFLIVFLIWRDGITGRPGAPLTTAPPQTTEEPTPAPEEKPSTNGGSGGGYTPQTIELGEADEQGRLAEDIRTSDTVKFLVAGVEHTLLLGGGRIDGPASLKIDGILSPLIEVGETINWDVTQDNIPDVRIKLVDMKNWEATILIKKFIPTLDVLVQDASGNNLSNALVQIRKTDNSLVYAGMTNSSGRIPAQSLDAGSYVVMVGASGYVYTTTESYYKNTTSLAKDTLLTVTLRTSGGGADRMPPTIFLVTPLDRASEFEGDIDFSYNFFDTSSVLSCSLILDGSLAETSTDGNRLITHTITTSLLPDTYIWAIKCIDEFGNNRTSENRTLTVINASINASIPQDGKIVTHSLTTAEFLQGVSIDVVLGDLIAFNITIGEGENATEQEHFISIEEITETTITIKVWSEVKTATITIGDSQMFELTDDEYYDLEVTFIGVVDGNASLIIESIYELVPSEENATCGDGVCQNIETQTDCCLDCGCLNGYTCQDNICISEDTGQPAPPTTTIPTTAIPQQAKAKGIAIKIIIIILILIVIFLIFRPTKGMKLKVKVEKTVPVKRVRVVKRKRR